MTANRRSPLQRFLAELKRRHVPQTVAVYVVAAWAAIQFADVIVPNLDWPQGVVTGVIIAAAVGFPVVVALAWFLEWGPEGLHRTPPEPGEVERPEIARGRAVEPTSSYTPWAVAVGVLSVGIAAALVVVALQGGGEAGLASEDEGPRTRSERRQAARDSLVPPIPPVMVRPGWTDSIARMANDSVMRALGSDGFDPSELGPLIEMAQRIGESAGRSAARGPIEIVEPETWRFGAPHPANPGDTLIIEGIARAEEGVESVEVNGLVVARGEDGDVELPFRATIEVPRGSGFRAVPVIVHVRDGEPIRREFSLSLVPRRPAPDPDG